MSEYVTLNETVEGEASDWCTRNQQWEGLHKHPITQQTMTLYKFTDNGSVELTKAGTEPEDEALKEQTKAWHRSVGDKIRGYRISCYADTKRKLRFDVQEGVSGRHGAQLLSFNKHTIANVTIPPVNLQPKIDMNLYNQLTKK